MAHRPRRVSGLVCNVGRSDHSVYQWDRGTIPYRQIVCFQCFVVLMKVQNTSDGIRSWSEYDEGSVSLILTILASVLPPSPDLEIC